jgi:hypothetical protein
MAPLKCGSSLDQVLCLRAPAPLYRLLCVGAEVLFAKFQHSLQCSGVLVQRHVSETARSRVAAMVASRDEAVTQKDMKAMKAMKARSAKKAMTWPLECAHVFYIDRLGL